MYRPFGVLSVFLVCYCYGEVKTVPPPSGNKIHKRHDGEAKTVPWPTGNKIHERHNRKVKTVALLGPDDCFKGESGFPYLGYHGSPVYPLILPNIYETQNRAARLNA